MSIIWIASKNKNKIIEIKKIFSDNLPNYILKSLLDLDNFEEIKETKKTIEKNSLLKAKYLANKIGSITLADDSGLEIKELNNFPGVKSKRWAYPITDENKINEMLLKKCQTLKNRDAVFKTVITYYDPKNKFYKQFTGILKGEISKNNIIQNGFGYDSIFALPNKVLLSQLTFEEKNKISHRAIAINLFIKWLIKYQKEIKGIKDKNEKN